MARGAVFDVNRLAQVSVFELLYTLLNMMTSIDRINKFTTFIMLAVNISKHAHSLRHDIQLVVQCWWQYNKLAVFLGFNYFVAQP